MTIAKPILTTVYYKFADIEDYRRIFDQEEVLFAHTLFPNLGRPSYPTGVILTNEDGDEYDEMRRPVAYYAMAGYDEANGQQEPEEAAQYRFPEEAERTEEDRIVWERRMFFAGHTPEDWQRYYDSLDGDD
ncbi:hypothetical protein [Halodurantibacterium flavum]|uniref:Uncharacterized protein n=1 Tax=Halodurantibacterium flavum TaxID=1382802 RepID=A0ABW4S927_9RHOB